MLKKINISKFDSRDTNYGQFQSDNSGIIKKMVVMSYYGALRGIFYFLVCCRIPYFETSAATGAEVDKAVITLLDLVMKRMEQCVDKPPAEPANGNGATKLDDALPSEKKCAC